MRRLDSTAPRVTSQQPGDVVGAKPQAVVPRSPLAQRDALTTTPRPRRNDDRVSTTVPLAPKNLALHGAAIALGDKQSFAPPALPHSVFNSGQSTIADELARVHGVVDVTGWKTTTLAAPGWYRQTSNSTCQPTSMVNGLLALESRVDAEAFSRLIESASKSSSGASVDATMAELGAGVVNVRQLVGKSDGGDGPFDKVHYPNDTLWGFFESAINAREVGLIGVRAKTYKGGNGRHAIAVTGVAESPTGERAVRLVDSEIGVLWLRLDALSRALEHKTVYAMAPARP